jgi:hypothetical protein
MTSINAPFQFLLHNAGLHCYKSKENYGAAWKRLKYYRYFDEATHVEAALRQAVPLTREVQYRF